MKILFLSAANSSHTVKWVNILAKRGHKLLLVSQIDHKAIEGEISPLVQIEYLVHSGIFGYYRNASQLRELATVYAPEVVNVHYATGYGTLARRAGLKPILLSVWGSDVYDFPTKNRVNRRLVEKNMAYATAIASTGYRMADKAKEYIKSDKRVFITPFGIDLDLFKPLPHAPTSEFVIGAIKRLEPESGIEILLKAFKIFRSMVRLDEPSRKFSLRIYGQGTEYTSLLGLTRDILINDETEFRGYVLNEDVPAVLAQMDIVCLPSIRESFGVAAIEAMACEKALVTSDADGFLETVDDGVTGIITHGFDENLLAQELFKLYKDELLRRALGIAGRQRVQKLYSLDECAKKMEEALFYTYSN